jgi:Txe/YoeB family toxin of Txe-Axe toxin-antitoxin module
MKNILKHLLGDKAMFEREAKEDGKLIKKISKKKIVKKKISKVMREFKEDKLHMGSKRGKLVKNPKQAIAIAINISKKKRK